MHTYQIARFLAELKVSVSLNIHCLHFLFIYTFELEIKRETGEKIEMF